MRKIADDVWQLRGFPQHMFNVYLAGDLLIDAGTRWAEGRIRRQLRGRDIRMLALTHCHPDHQGSAAAICKAFGVPLACHEGDMPAVEGRAPMQPDNRLLRLGCRFWAGPPYPVGRVLRDGDDVAGFRVVHAPGHTPGHIMLFRASDRLLIAGDVLANMNFITGRAGLRLPPKVFSANPTENRRSLQLLTDLKPALVCFGHGPPLRNLDQLERFSAARRLEGARRLPNVR